MGLLDDLEDLLDPIFDGVRGVFGGGDDDAGDDDLSPQERVDQILNGGNPRAVRPGTWGGPRRAPPGGAERFAGGSRPSRYHLPAGRGCSSDH